MKKSRVMCVNNFGSSQRFLGVFVEFPKIKSSPITGVSQITKYLNINPILTSHYYIQKIKASMTCFCKTFISSLTSQLWCTKNLLCKWRHYPTVTTLPDLTVRFLRFRFRFRFHNTARKYKITWDLDPKNDFPDTGQQHCFPVKGPQTVVVEVIKVHVEALRMTVETPVWVW
jgi:hypothetical protein